jgi:predicted nucleotidyltransferase
MMREDVGLVLRALRGALEALYGDQLVTMVLFGSQARGESAPGSDIDVLVVLRGEVNPADEIARSGQQVAALSLAHDVVISCVFMPESRFHTAHSALLRTVRREGVPV